MKIFELKSEQSLKLYRGDSSNIEKFDIDMTDDMGLFGIGMYLTDDPTVAKDYTLKQSEHVIYTNEHAENPRDLVISYLDDLISKELGWEKEKQDVREEWQRKVWAMKTDGIPDDTIHKLYKNDLQKRLQKHMKRAKVIYRQRRTTMRIVKKTTGEYAFVKNNRSGYIMSFEIPLSYINRTIHTERPLSDQLISFLGEFIRNHGFSGKIDMRDLDGKFLTFDEYIENFKSNGSYFAWSDNRIVGGKGENPSYDVITNGTHFGITFFGRREIQKDLIEKLMEIGYVGLEYQGGVRVTGTGARGGGAIGQLHRVFVLWDTDAVYDFKTSTEQVADDQIADELEKGIRAMKIPSI